MVRLDSAVIVGLLCLGAAAEARAQEEPLPEQAEHVEPPDAAGSEVDEARELFLRGVELSEQERWGEALELFRRSRAITDRPSTTFNIAVALLRLGRPTEGLTALRDYLRIAGPEDEARRAEAQELLELALSSVAELTLEVEPPFAEVRVDGALQAGDTRERVLTLDPGAHTVRVSAERHEPEAFEVSLLTAERASRHVTLQRLPDPIVRPVTPEPPPEPALLEQPWLWIVAGVIVVGAGVGIGVALASGTEDPYPGTTGVVLQGLR